MNKNNTPEEIWQTIKNSKNIVFSLHYGPDGDSLGSTTAIKYILEKQLNKKVRLVSKDPLDKTLSELSYSKEVEFGKGIDELNLEGYDLIIAIDTGTKKQFIGREKEFELPGNIKLINIDHHETNDYYGSLNYVNTKKSSACAVLLEIIKKLDIYINKELATRLLLGIYTDSGYFSHDNGESIKDAAFLIEKGADYLNEIVNKIKYNIPLNIKKYHGILYNNFKILEINNLKVGCSYITLEEIKKLNLSLSDVRGGINDLQEIGGVDVIFTLGEKEDNIKGSFRTRKEIDVSKLAKKLNGGGHKKAAAFILPKMPLKKAEEKVIETIKNLK
jgi:bifunctional oligoribonuclease and PAP phosphatase NrnA